MTGDAAVGHTLAKLLPRLGSTHDGEIVATAAAIRRVLAGAGLDLHDLAAAVAGSADLRRWRRPDDDADLAASLLAYENVLTEWERIFCRSLAGRVDLSEKQHDTLEVIARKVAVFTEAGGEAA